MSSTLHNFIFVSIFSSLALALDYCTLTCDIGGKIYQNSACNKSNCNPKTIGCDLKLIPTSEEIREYILNQHNIFRNTIATRPPSNSWHLGEVSNMQVMRYDLELEHSAQCNDKIYNCSFNKDVCRITENYRSVGQNTAIVQCKGDQACEINASQKDYRKMCWRILNDWWEQSDYWRLKSDIKGAELEIKQILNAESNRIGCGLFAEEKGSFILVCNYASEVKPVQTKIFEEGPPCSACPAENGCDPVYTGLCVDKKRTTTTLIYAEQKTSTRSNEKPFTTTLPSTMSTEAKNNSNSSTHRTEHSGARATRGSVILVNCLLGFLGVLWKRNCL